jgi:hypothetical protein
LAGFTAPDLSPAHAHAAEIPNSVLTAAFQGQQSQLRRTVPGVIDLELVPVADDVPGRAMHDQVLLHPLAGCEDSYFKRAQKSF